MRGFWVVVVIVALLAGAARAGPRSPGAVLADLPAALDSLLRDDPDGFADLGAGLIAGHGGVQGLDAAGIARFVALERAAARSRAMARLWPADLDNDGQVTAAEVALLAAAAGARSRGRILLAFQTADGDDDGTVTTEELRNYGQMQALKSLPAAEADMLAGFMALDLDGNGFLILEEMKQVLSAQIQAT